MIPKIQFVLIIHDIFVNATKCLQSELISVISKSIILTYFFLTKFANLDIDKPGSDLAEEDFIRWLFPNVGLIQVYLQDTGQNSNFISNTHF